MDYLPVAYIFSNENFLSKELSDELKKKGCEVISVNSSNFSQRTKKTPSYVFLIQGFGEKEKFFSSLQNKEIFKFIHEYLPKTQVILPYVLNEKTSKRVEGARSLFGKSTNRNLGIIYLGETSPDIFEEMKSGGLVRVPLYDFDLYLLNKEKVVDELTRGIFSYGFGKREIVLGSKIKFFDLASRIRKLAPSTIFATDEKIKPQTNVAGVDLIDIPFSDTSLKEMLDDIRVNKSLKTIAIPKKTYVRVKRKRKIISAKKIKFLFFAFFIFVFVMLLPFVMLFSSYLSFRAGVQNFQNKNYKSANNYFNFSSKISSFISPVLFLDDAKRGNNIITSFDAIGIKGIETVNLSNKLIGDVSNNSSFDLKVESDNLTLNFSSLYDQINFLRADLNSFRFAKKIVPDNIDVTSLSNYASFGKQISQELPKILGDEKPTNYLVLLQDKNEIWPTGGAIRNLKVYSFDKGHLVSSNAVDVKSADSQLRGIVAPPQLLTKYLGISNYKLAYSNWDLDFPTAANKAEWFLEKEMNQSVDGVIAINGDIGEDFIGALKRKDVMLFLNDNNLSDSINNMNWGGEVLPPTCNGLDNCQVNWFGIVEANLGGNAVNQYIKRSSEFFSNMTGNSVSNTLEINYDNTASANYRTYVRVITDSTANFSKVDENINNIDQTIQPDTLLINGRVEAGVLIQIPAHTKARLVFNWTDAKGVTYEKDGKIIFYERKQPGVDQTPTNINLVIPSFLTHGIKTSYNTSLESDFIKEINW